MDLSSTLLLGLSTALQFENLLACFMGVLLGTLVGVLPGVGPAATIAMLLPITFSLSPAASVIMLAGIYYGAQYGGSTTAILLNLPGESSSAVTAIDGYRMARMGRAGPALATAAIASFVAGTFATLVIAVAAPPLTALALQFASVEYFSLIVFGVICSVALAHGAILKALAMVVFGILLGTVGTDVYTGEARFTLGYLQLFDGLDVVALAVGIFGIAEILKNLENESGRVNTAVEIGRMMPSREDMKRSVGPIVRGSILGSLLGILPGGGALLSSFASYAMEKRLSKHPEQFGQGAIEGVAGPEAANNAGAQTSFIPMLTLGIPSNVVMALMIGALMLQGIIPGPQIATERPDLFWGLIASMWVGNLMLVVLNLPLVGLWVRLLAVPYYMLFPAIIAFSTIGIYSIGANAFDVYTLTAFGLIGYFLMKTDCEPAPFLLGFILGPMLEEHLRRAMLVSRGDPTVFLTSPISAAFLGLSAILLIAVSRSAIRKQREMIFVED
ncbi:tripartite tricarboxylate transporter permease [Devosia sp. A369]